jgi:AcrR family transcriptional regulator
VNTKLDRQAWIGAGLAMLAEGGVDAVRVERLARVLKVTKGSFYWHFKDRPALLAALLEAWQAEATTAIIARVEAGGGDAAARLRHLLAIVVRSDGRLDMAVRDWAGYDMAVRAAQDAVDRQRLGYVEGLFRDLGFPPAAALARARFAYQALIGQFRMGGQGVEDRVREVLDIIFPMLTRSEG